MLFHFLFHYYPFYFLFIHEILLDIDFYGFKLSFRFVKTQFETIEILFKCRTLFSERLLNIQISSQTIVHIVTCLSKE